MRQQRFAEMRQCSCIIAYDCVCIEIASTTSMCVVVEGSFFLFMACDVGEISYRSWRCRRVGVRFQSKRTLPIVSIYDQA
jgi:hypothetical protein